MSEWMEKCSVCDALVDEEDLFCANCGTEVPQHAGAAQTGSRQATHNFACLGCGASMSYDASAGTLRCPFCGSQKLEEQPDAKVLAPSRVAPFQVTHASATEIMRKYLGTGMWRPGDLAQQAAVVTMTAVYVPFWVFKARTLTYWTADSSSTPAGARADWYPVFGKHRGAHENLLIGASGALTQRQTAALAPFDLSLAVPTAEVDLENVTVEQFSVMRKYARPVAREGIERLEAQHCEQYVPGKSRNLKVSSLIEGLESEPILLPVWIMAYRYQDRVFQFLINGQTGKATGEAPVSWRKIVMVVGAAVLALVVVLALFSRR